MWKNDLFFLSPPPFFFNVSGKHFCVWIPGFPPPLEVLCGPGGGRVWDLRSCEENPSDPDTWILRRAARPSLPVGIFRVDLDPEENHHGWGLLARGAGQSRWAPNCLSPSGFPLEKVQGSAFPSRNPGWECQTLLPVPLGVSLGVPRALHAQGWAQLCCSVILPKIGAL